jgi:tetratricopeptide (TPR) repeat protein
MTDTSPGPCHDHLRAAAGWFCGACQARLCPDCATVRRAMSTEYLACGRCQGPIEPLLLHRSSVPLTTRLRQSWRYPASSSALPFMLGLSAVLAVLRWAMVETFLLLKWLPTVMWLGVFWGAFFSVVRATARGEQTLDTPDYSDAYKDCVVPALRGLVATSGVWLPVALYLLCFSDLDVRGPVTDLSNQPAFYVTGGLPAFDWGPVVKDSVLWLLLLAGFAYLPLVLLLAATGTGVLQMLNPLTALRAAARLGKDYALTLGALALLCGVMALGHAVAAGFRGLHLAFVSPFAAELVTTLAPVLMAHVLGLLLYTRGDVLGYGEPRDYYLPVLGAVQPRAGVPPLREATTPAPEASPEATPPQDGLLQALAQAVEAKDAEKAVALYAGLQTPQVSKRVEPAQHFFVGQSAIARGQYALAVQALESAADVAPEGPLASRALVLQARVYAERLRDAERAENIYRYILHRYPGTEASHFAQKHLPRPTA